MTRLFYFRYAGIFPVWLVARRRPQTLELRLFIPPGYYVIGATR